jgi:hypothetical protein
LKLSKYSFSTGLPGRMNARRMSCWDVLLEEHALAGGSYSESDLGRSYPVANVRFHGEVGPVGVVSGRSCL